MIKISLLKKICMFLTLVMLLSCIFNVFAEGNDTISGDNIIPLEEGDENQDDVLVPTTTPIGINVNYFEDGKVIFSTHDSISEMKNFNFTISFSDATIISSEFDASMKNGSLYSVETVGSQTVKFKNGSGENLLSGKITLCILNVNENGVELSTENISFSEFTAVNNTDETVTYSPTLYVNEGPVVPALSDKEKAVYDAIIALPDVTSLSFYKDEKLADLNELTKYITDTKASFDALTQTQKTNILANLDYYYNMQDTSKLTNLFSVAEGMKNVYDVLTLADILSGVSEDDKIKYQFVCDIYNDIKDEIDSSGLPENSTVLSQYQTAVNLITATETAISEKWNLESFTYDNKRIALTAEFEIVKAKYTSKYHNDFLKSLLDRTTALYEDADENYEGDIIYKNALLNAIDTLIDNVSGLIDGLSNPPEFSVTDFRRKTSYTVSLTRRNPYTYDAKVKIVVFKESDAQNKIDEKSFDFKKGYTTLDASMTASVSEYPVNENVVIHVYYSISDSEVYVGNKTVLCKREIDTISPNSGIPSKENNNSKPDTNEEISGGTIFPSGKDEADDKDEDDEPVKETELFSDIKKYNWAKDAIEGLYYAGIVNGMEEGVFNPAGNVTREQFCKMAVQLFGVLQNDTITNFVDVAPDTWYAQYINSAIKAGYVQGQSDEYFGIGESIMRQDMATILYRGLGSKNKGVELNFTDNDSIAPYAQTAISELVGLGVLNGYEDGSFNPRGTATRAEAAKVIWEVYKILND